jgi:hypothetical protein
MRKERALLKVIYVVAFVSAAVLAFIVTKPIADWVKTFDGIFNNVFVQLLCVTPIGILVAVLEDRIIQKLNPDTEFASVAPVSIGLCVGYILHFAVKI